MSNVGLRPYLPSDARACAKLFRESVDALTLDDYDSEQREAWSARVDDEAAFARKLAESLTLVAAVGGPLAGFASLKEETIDLLYVSPNFARRGVATALVDALLKLAKARGAKRVATEASDTARPLFAKMGFVAERRSLVALGDVWLPRTAMTLSFAAPVSGVSSQFLSKH
jgi:putative acetyltransferase